MKLHDINDVKLAAKYGESRFWFSPETMRFFASRVGHKAWTDGEGGAYFVTSERAWGEGPRLYSVRYRTPEGRISTVGTFQGFASGVEAGEAAALYATMPASVAAEIAQ